MKRQYDAFTDEELIEQLRDGDSAVMDFLMEKYKYLVCKKANAVFLLGGDTYAFRGTCFFRPAASIA